MSFFSKDTGVYLRKLRENNNRDWFRDNRLEYDRVVAEPTNLFAMTLADALEAETARCYVPRILRIFRDVRFSKDKTPYNVHIRISFSSDTESGAPSYFFSLEHDHLMLGAGVFKYEGSELDTFRRRVSGGGGAELQGITLRLACMGIRLSEPELKRVPKPYGIDHPRANLLRHKGLTAWLDDLEPGIAYGTDAIQACVREFMKMKTLYDWLSKTNFSSRVLY